MDVYPLCPTPALAASLVCATLALVDSGVEMLDTPTACSVVSQHSRLASELQLVEKVHLSRVCVCVCVWTVQTVCRLFAVRKTVSFPNPVWCVHMCIRARACMCVLRKGY